MNFIDNHIYIVTGASSGIGATVTNMLNELGFYVVAIARNETRLNNIKNKCKYPSKIFIEKKDLSEDIEGLPKYVSSLKEKYGKFSGMVYCAGIVDVSPLQLLDRKKCENIYKTDLFAPLFFTKGIADRRNNIGRGTSIIFIAGMCTMQCNKAHFLYTGAKSALISTSKCLAKELAGAGIRLNCVSPSDIETPMTMSELNYEATIERTKKYPFGIGHPRDVANIVLFLLSDKTRWITGQNYIVDCASL